MLRKYLHKHPYPGCFGSYLIQVIYVAYLIPQFNPAPVVEILHLRPGGIISWLGLGKCGGEIKSKGRCNIYLLCIKSSRADKGLSLEHEYALFICGNLLKTISLKWRWEAHL